MENKSKIFLCTLPDSDVTTPHLIRANFFNGEDFVVYDKNKLPSEQCGLKLDIDECINARYTEAVVYYNIACDTYRSSTVIEIRP